MHGYQNQIEIIILSYIGFVLDSHLVTMETAGVVRVHDDMNCSCLDTMHSCYGAHFGLLLWTGEIRREQQRRQVWTIKNLFRHNFSSNGFLFADGHENCYQKLFTTMKLLCDVFSEVPFWYFQVLFHFTIFIHKFEKAIVNVDQLVVLSRYIWYIHIVSRGANIFQLFSSENIESDQMDFSMSMLSCLGG